MKNEKNFELIFEKLGIPEDWFPNFGPPIEESHPIPSVKNFPEYKTWLLAMLEKIEKNL